MSDKLPHSVLVGNDVPETGEMVKERGQGSYGCYLEPN